MRYELDCKQVLNTQHVSEAAPLPGMNQRSISPPSSSCSQTQPAPLCPHISWFPPLQIYSLKMGLTNTWWSARADRPRSLHTHMLFRSELRLVSLVRKWNSVVAAERWNGAERSPAGSGNLLLFHLSGSTEGSGDYSLWTQLLHELY